MEQKENLKSGEREMMSLHDFILSAFRKEFGDTVIGVNPVRKDGAFTPTFLLRN